MKKIVSGKRRLSAVNFAPVEQLNLEKLWLEIFDSAAFRVRKHLELKKTLFAFLTLWNLLSW